MWNNAGDYDGGFDQGGGYLSSQSDTQDKKKTRVQHIMPCTLARLMKAEHVEDKFISDGVELNQVSVVALVLSAQETTTNQVYRVDDMTGPIMEVRVFADNDPDMLESDKVPLFRENTYIHAWGHLRSFGGNRNITAFRICQVDDMEELTHHILECTYAHLYHSKELHLMRLKNAHHFQNRTTNPGQQPGMRPRVDGGMNAAATVDAGDMGLTPVQMQVLNLIRTSVEDHGITTTTLSNQLKGLPRKAITEALDFLSSEGHIYSTIDDEHFKATDSI
ncbi:hypothetical protein HELRODRAFT_170399 [Helobdella robusta]|uniref:Replication protein A C-terminal domain-containing protein n=1 Tax=Helobdella robusta TaxID=6412 RepID=T1F304_HELRO|nr:hypothetical protein HELRODRAFT_170399 [Helobdella robusta]ESO07100.1 hypothetical protein HELRODRAFT_170399 [Helobdella robusta]